MFGNEIRNTFFPATKRLVNKPWGFNTFLWSTWVRNSSGDSLPLTIQYHPGFYMIFVKYLLLHPEVLATLSRKLALNLSIFQESSEILVAVSPNDYLSFLSAFRQLNSINRLGTHKTSMSASFPRFFFFINFQIISLWLLLVLWTDHVLTIRTRTFGQRPIECQRHNTNLSFFLYL